MERKDPARALTRTNSGTGAKVKGTHEAWVAALLMGALLGPAAGHSATLEAVVNSDGGGPVKDAVVFALPLDANGKPVAPPKPIDIDQVDKEYVPYVTAVQVGTAINFPNHDQIRHHVYSFSDAKTFEIPLYRGTPRDPILFDQPGAVPLGCNIHDWMSAYVFVSETPYFALTDAAGRANLAGLPPGDYAVRVWHPRLKGDPEATSQRISAASDSDSSLTFSIQEKRVWRPRRAPSLAGGGYR